MEKDGKLTMFERWDYEVMEEFGFNVTDMASAIRELREELEKTQKELEQAKDAVDNHG